jgi:hypothetical protein
MPAPKQRRVVGGHSSEERAATLAASQGVRSTKSLCSSSRCSRPRRASDRSQGARWPCGTFEPAGLSGPAASRRRAGLAMLGSPAPLRGPSYTLRPAKGTVSRASGQELRKPSGSRGAVARTCVPAGTHRSGAFRRAVSQATKKARFPGPSLCNALHTFSGAPGAPTPG